MKSLAFLMRKRVPVRLWASALAVMATGPVLAQGQPSGTLPEVVVTATRIAQAQGSVLADVTVIDADVIERSGAVSLADVLVHAPGVEMVRNGGPMGTTSLYLRGAATHHTVVMIDGIRLDTQSGSGGATCQSIPAYQIDRIEILRGPAAAVYGSDAMAGVIQVFTKNGQMGVRPSLGFGLGTYGTRTATAGLLGGQSGWRYALSLGHETSDGYNIQPAANPDNDGYRRNTASLRLGRDLNADHTLEGTWVYSDADAGYDSTTSKASVDYPKDNRTRQQLNALGLNWHAKWSDVWSSTLGVTQALDHYQTLPAPGEAPGYDTETRIQTALWNNTLNWRDAVWTLALEERQDALTNTGTTPQDTRRNQHALALGYGAQRGAHSWQANARLDQDSEFGSHTTGALSYGYHVTPQWRWSASMGTGFRSPTLYQRFSDYGFAGLKPEESVNQELALTYRQDAHQASLVAYHTRVSNLIAFGAAGACASAFGCYGNTAKATLQGVTVSGQSRWHGAFLTASLDLQNPVDAASGNRLARRAQRLLKLSAESSWQGWDWNADVLLSGDRYDDAANTTAKLLPGYGLINVGVSRQIQPQTELLIRVGNLGDIAYETAKGYANPGRNLFVGLKWNAR